MNQYKNLVEKILHNGVYRTDRTGTGTKSVFGTQTRFNITNEFPLVTLKETHWPSIVHELLWFLKGDTNIKYLNDNNVKIWNEWSDKEGNLGPIYGHQWVNWGQVEKEITDHRGGLINPYFCDCQERIEGEDGYSYVQKHKKGINQIQNAIDTLKTNPESRRIIVSAWNVGELDEMALPPCHTFFQFYTEPISVFELNEYKQKNGYGFRNQDKKEVEFPKHKLSLQLYQRSCDVALGGPFNIASYSLLLKMFSQCVNMIPNEFIWTIGDAHIYNNHLDGCRELVKRDPLPSPKVRLNPEIKNIFDFKYEDITLENYKSHPKIKLPVAV